MSRRVLLGTGLGLCIATALAYGPGRDPRLPPLIGALIASLFIVPIAVLTTVALPLAVQNAREYPRLRQIWAAGTLFFGIAAIANSVSSRATATAFAARGDSTVGLVLSTHPGDHNSIDVQYSVAGNLLQERIGAPGLARDLSPNATLMVYYLKGDPTRARSDWPTWSPVEDVIGFGLAAVLMPTWLIGLGGAWLHRRGRLSTGS